MGKSTEIAKKTIDEKIAKGESFSFAEIQKEIKNNGGILYFSGDYSVGDYLNDLERARIIAYNDHTNEFIVLDKAA